jgi:hypothetical protein
MTMDNMVQKSCDLHAKVTKVRMLTHTHNIEYLILITAVQNVL